MIEATGPARAYDADGDICLGFWKEAWEAGWCDFPPNAKVLELGCAEADWQTPMLATRPDLHITGIDWREIQRPGALIIQGDILQQDFGEAAFDAIMAVSHVEWVGIGNYTDPVLEDGDRIEMALCARWLKPGGWMYLDVPYRPIRARDYVPFKGRGYTPTMIQDRIVAPHFRIVQQQTFNPNHRDAPYIALLLRHA